MISEIILNEVTASYGSASAVVCVGSLEEDWIESCHHGGECEVSATKGPSILYFQKETKIRSQKYSSIVIKNILDSFNNH